MGSDLLTAQYINCFWPALAITEPMSRDQRERWMLAKQNLVTSACSGELQFDVFVSPTLCLNFTCSIRPTPNTYASADASAIIAVTRNAT
jgi:hypothetical protein